MKATGVLILFLFSGLVARSQKLEVKFEVTLKGKSIGNLYAVEEKTGNRIVRDLRTNTDAKVIVMAVHVESELNVTH